MTTTTAQHHPAAELVLVGGRITTLDPARPSASAVAIAGGRFVAVGDERDVQAWQGPATRVVDLRGRRVIPGLNDSHTHVIRGGLTYNAELRWEGVTSLGEALERLRQQALRTPAPQWVRGATRQQRLGGRTTITAPTATDMRTDTTRRTAYYTK